MGKTMLNLNRPRKNEARLKKEGKRTLAQFERVFKLYFFPLWSLETIVTILNSALKVDRLFHTLKFENI